MNAKLDKLRAEHEKALKKLEEAQMKVEEAAERVREGEATEVLNIVAELKWTPEQLADFIKENKGKKDNSFAENSFHNMFGKVDSQESEERKDGII